MGTVNQRQFILASKSPRRRDLLSLLDFEFEVRSADVDEREFLGEHPAAYTQRVSLMKAKAIAATMNQPALILSADTTVADGEQILGKPADPDQAYAMLDQLRGRAHQVYTAITLLDTATSQRRQDLAVTRVVMRDYTDAEIHEYIQSGDPFDKAGSYAIQNAEFSPVDHIEGCYANVVGLPLCHVLRCLNQWKMTVEVDVPAVCQQAHAITCPVYEDILAGSPTSKAD
jgi:MAF protein